MQSISSRDILNRRVRGESLYEIYTYIQNVNPSMNQCIEIFSIGDKEKSDELTRESLLFLQNLNLISGDEKLKVTYEIKTEWEFKIKIIESIRNHPDEYINYFNNILGDVYRLDSTFGNNEFLNTLQKARRDIGFSDESMRDTGKFENLKPIIEYLGLVGKFRVGNRVKYLQCIDPFLLHEILNYYPKTTEDIQIADFIAWMDEKLLLSVDELGDPFPAVKNSFLSAESSKLIKLDRPADFRKEIHLARNRRISRVRLS